MTTAYIALGSNLGKRQTALRAALARLARLPRTGVLAVATFRETAPVDCPTGARAFINSAASLDTNLPAIDLLGHLLQIEHDLGRQRSADSPHAARTIDLDLLLYGDLVLATPGIEVPHPRMHQRRFVLEPLAEIAPDVLHPPTGKTIRQLLAELPESPPPTPERDARTTLQGQRS